MIDMHIHLKYYKMNWEKAGPWNDSDCCAQMSKVLRETHPIVSQLLQFNVTNLTLQSFLNSRGNRLKLLAKQIVMRKL